MASEKSIPVNVNTLLTHIHPDLDAVLSVYLIRRHGEERFPGAGSAGLIFSSANTLPDGKTADQLEDEGIMPLDIGGGRFDTHPVADRDNVEKWDTCASQLVAEELGVAGLDRYRFLLPFTLAQDSAGKSLTSKDAAHHLLAPHSLLEGLHNKLDNDAEVVKVAFHLVEGIMDASESDEPVTDELAGMFDKSLATFLKESYEPFTDHDRKTPEDWLAEGESHRLALEKGWSKRRELEKLLRTCGRLLAGDKTALPVNENERRVLLPSALMALYTRYGEDSSDYREIAATLFNAAIKREADWFDAVFEVKRSAKTIRGRHSNVVAIASRNGLVIKAARYSRGADGVLYFEPKRGLVTVQAGYRADGRPHLNLERIAARLRTADSVKQGNNKPIKNAKSVGMTAGWFLHPSLQLLNRGSPKAPDVNPTALSYQELIEMVRCEIQPEMKLPDWCCPPDRCTENECAFFQLKLSNCHAHRRKLKDQPRKGTFGDLFQSQLKDIKKKMK